MAQSAGGVASGMEDAAGGIGDVGSAAKKSEKKLKGFIAGWHEVNNMTSNDDSGGSGGGFSGGGSGGGGRRLLVKNILQTNIELKFSKNISKPDKISELRCFLFNREQ